VTTDNPSQQNMKHPANKWSYWITNFKYRHFQLGISSSDLLKIHYGPPSAFDIKMSNNDIL